MKLRCQIIRQIVRRFALQTPNDATAVRCLTNLDIQQLKRIRLKPNPPQAKNALRRLQKTINAHKHLGRRHLSTMLNSGAPQQSALRQREPIHNALTNRIIVKRPSVMENCEIKKKMPFRLRNEALLNKLAPKILHFLGFQNVWLNWACARDEKPKSGF